MGLERNRNNVRTAGLRLLPKASVLFWQSLRRTPEDAAKRFRSRRPRRRKSMVVDRVILGETRPSQACSRVRGLKTERFRARCTQEVWWRWRKFQVIAAYGANSFLFHGNRGQYGLPLFFKKLHRGPGFGFATR